ncbi:MAG: hypothetical protein KGH72_05485 [Candidatus Micrarchaeota archaeon]|nr:hypothetical protein [Candidatus Micrarchaeota archaeon]
MTPRRLAQPREQTIMPLNKSLSYIDARDAVRNLGGLPSNVDHDVVLVHSRERANAMLHVGYRAAWAREMLVYPEIGGAFRAGVNVVDSQRDSEGRQWIFPYQYVPEEALSVRGAALFVDPADIHATRVRVVVVPQSIVVLSQFPQNIMVRGEIDPETRVPREVSRAQSVLGYTYDSNFAFALDTVDRRARWLYRIGGAGVRPILRVNFDRGSRQALYVDVDPTSRMSVGMLVEDPFAEALRA